MDEPSDLGTDACYVVDDRGNRKLLFKKRSTSSTCPVSIFIAYNSRVVCEVFTILLLMQKYIFSVLFDNIGS